MEITILMTPVLQSPRKGAFQGGWGVTVSQYGWACATTMTSSGRQEVLSSQRGELGTHFMLKVVSSILMASCPF